MKFTARVQDNDESTLASALSAVFPGRSASQQSSLLRTIGQSASPGAAGVLESPDACARIASWIDRLVDEAAGICRHMASANWLFLLRRFPEALVAGARPSTGVNRLGTAEVLSGLFPGPPQAQGPHQDRARFEITRESVLLVCDLVAVAAAIVSYQSLYRLCAKGARLELSPDGKHRPVYGSEIAEAVRLYDDRNAKATGELSVQVESGARFMSSPESLGSGTLLGVNRSSKWSAEVSAENAPKVLNLPPMVTDLAVEANFIPAVLNTSRLRDFEQRSRTGEIWWNAGIPAVLACMRAAALSAEDFISLLQRGYLVYEKNRFRSVFADALREVRAELPGIMQGHDEQELFTLMRSLRGSVWPHIFGPIVRETEELVYVDIAAATGYLQRMLASPLVGGGKVVNIRAASFESDIQDVINSSPWKPRPDLLKLRGRTLRVGGVSVTDLDAVGELSGVLLAVSAKSVPYTLEYEKGEHAVVRNLADRCDSYVADWEKRMAVLSSRPLGDNYDLRDYSQIVGAVCLPFVPYCRIGSATRWVRPGLRAVSSITELAEFLGMTDTP